MIAVHCILLMNLVMIIENRKCLSSNNLIISIHNDHHTMISAEFMDCIIDIFHIIFLLLILNYAHLIHLRMAMQKLMEKLYSSIRRCIINNYNVIVVVMLIQHRFNIVKVSELVIKYRNPA